VRLGTGKVMRPRAEPLNALQAEPQGMHGVLRVVSVDGHQLRAVGVGAGLAGHRGLLCLQVAHEAFAGQS
jgi:hypothetical protein